MAADDIDLLHFRPRKGGADLLLDAFGRGFADEHVVLPTHVGNDGLVELVAADAHRLGVDDAVQRNDRDFRSTAADVHHHRAARLGNRDARTECGGDRFLDHEHLACTGVLDRLADRAAFDLGRAIRHADHDAGHRPHHATFLHLADEVLEHLFRDRVIRDHAVAQRADRRDIGRRAAEHALGIDADGLDLLAAARVEADGDDRRLVEYDALVTHIDQRVGGAEIDGKVVDEQAADGVEHRGRGIRLV